MVVALMLHRQNASELHFIEYQEEMRMPTPNAQHVVGTETWTSGIALPTTFRTTLTLQWRSEQTLGEWLLPTACGSCQKGICGVAYGSRSISCGRWENGKIQ